MTLIRNLTKFVLQKNRRKLEQNKLAQNTNKFLTKPFVAINNFLKLQLISENPLGLFPSVEKKSFLRYIKGSMWMTDSNGVIISPQAHKHYLKRSI